MAKDTSDNPFLGGNYAPVLDELDVELTVWGDLPPELEGSLYRNGPNPHFQPSAEHHWFHGDGMVHGFELRGGRAWYRNRWVRTPKWLAENAAGRRLFGPGGAPLYSDSALASLDTGLANTNILWHGGRLLALEEVHAPFELDPATLGSRGYLDFGGPVTAHPKIDPETGELVFFAYAADGPMTSTIAYGVADRAGRLIRRETFQAPYCSMIHDFLVTREHVLFPVLPLSGDADRAAAGGPGYAWEPGKGAFVGVMRRDTGASSLRWFCLEPNYVYHVMNAFDRDGTVVADVMQFDTAPLFPNVDGSFRPPAAAVLTRWTFDMDAPTDQGRQAPLDDMPGEFPRFDERRSGLPYRHGWLAGQITRPGSLWSDSLAHIDLATGRREIWALPDGDAVSEPGLRAAARRRRGRRWLDPGRCLPGARRRQRTGGAGGAGHRQGAGRHGQDAATRSLRLPRQLASGFVAGGDMTSRRAPGSSSGFQLGIHVSHKRFLSYNSGCSGQHGLWKKSNNISM